MGIKKIGLQFLFFVLSLPDFGTSVILVSQNKSGSIPLLSVL
jgi:hypothetical protein